MFLFIFESIGTSELVLIGIVALIFLGPRKLPEIAKMVGKYMADFRKTTNEFKQTWEREANFEQFEHELKGTDTLPEKPVARVTSINGVAEEMPVPEIKEIDKASFENFVSSTEPAASSQPAADDLSDKRNWL